MILLNNACFQTFLDARAFRVIRGGDTGPGVRAVPVDAPDSLDLRPETRHSPLMRVPRGSAPGSAKP